MVRKHLVAVCVLASAVMTAGLLTASPAHAQEVLNLDQPAKPKPKPVHHYHYRPRHHHAAPHRGRHAKPSAAATHSKKVDVNLDKNAPEQQGPVQAGQPSQEFAQAKKLFDRERWMEAALALSRVVDKETPDDAGNRQLAQYYLAICLYRLKFYQAAYSRFGAIADNKYHLKFKETLLWLSKLATQLPTPADIIERVGKYSDEEIARFNNPQQRDLYWQLNYLLGRYLYRNRRFPDAIAAFHKVGRDSQYYVKSQFFTGISYVQLRKSVPAVQSFERILKAINEGVKGVKDESRMRDLAYLSMARTFYSASIRLNPETNAPTVDAKRLSAAVKYWNEIDVTSEYWLDALFEESWAYFMAGDYPRALGNIQTIESPYFPHAFYPEADIVKAIIFFSNCNYDAATIVVARFDKKYTPIRNKLQAVLNRFKGPNQEEPFFKFLTEVRNHTANLDPQIRGIVENALSDRQLLRNIDYVHMLDAEISRFHKSPSSFRASNLGQETEDALQQARQLAVKHTGQLAIERYQRNLDDLNEHLRDGAKILIDITAAQRNLLDQAIKKNQVSKAESKIYGIVKPDSEHVRWPFDGEYWRDELGFYREVVQSACGR